MKKLINWYITTWKKGDNMSDLECLEMCYVSAFLVMACAGIYALICLLYNYLKT